MSEVRMWIIMGKGDVPVMQVDNNLHQEFSGGLKNEHGHIFFEGTESEFDKVLDYYNSLPDDELKIYWCGDYEEISGEPYKGEN